MYMVTIGDFFPTLFLTLLWQTLMEHCLSHTLSDILRNLLVACINVTIMGKPHLVALRHADFLDINLPRETYDGYCSCTSSLESRYDNYLSNFI